MPAAKTPATPAQRTGADKPLLSVNLSFTKETKGTVRYDAPQNEKDRIGGAVNIYIPKTAMPAGTPPQNVTLMIVPMA